ncbi:MAG: hypothetical protein AB7P03_01495 [Kofleriaceae bacterium]
MLIAVERLLIKVRQPRSRAAELIALRQRLRDERAREITDEQRELAREVTARKLAFAAELGSVASCGTCATRKPWPRGGYEGGDCCAGVTSQLFDDVELATLAHTGTRPRDLVPPAGDDVHAGCAFRGPRGCSLGVAHRPPRCVHYVCDKLRSELHARGQLDTVEAKLAELNGAVQRFGASRQAQLDRDVVAPIIDAISASRGDGR